MKQPLRVLVVEDSEFDAKMLVRLLDRGGYATAYERVQTADEMARALAEKQWDLVLSDYNLPGFNATLALQLLQATHLDIPFIIVSGGIGEDIAVAAMKSGASDYLMKGNLARLVPAVERELRDAAVRQARRRAEAELRESEQRYRLLWETATDAILLMDTRSDILFANPAVQGIFGYSPTEVVGKNFAMLLPEKLRSTSDTAFQRHGQIVTTAQRRTLETAGVKRDGSEVLLELAFNDMELGGQRLFVAFIRDITERRRHEAEIRKGRQEFAAAREVQSRLFPKSAPRVPGFDIAGLSQAAEATGGDSFDYVPLPDGSWGVLVADVAGHGMGPALLMAETRFCLRMTARSASGPADILTQANRLLAEDLGGDRYVTVSLAAIHPGSRVLRHASAGHPATWVLDATGRVKARLRRTGKPLGRQGTAAYTENPPVPLESGDTVLQLTDGIDEAMRADGSLFTVERVLDLIRGNGAMAAAPLAELICAEARAFTQPEPQTDDFTVVIVRVL